MSLLCQFEKKIHAQFRVLCVEMFSFNEMTWYTVIGFLYRIPVICLEMLRCCFYNAFISRL